MWIMVHIAQLITCSISGCLFPLRTPLREGGGGDKHGMLHSGDSFVTRAALSYYVTVFLPSSWMFSLNHIWRMSTREGTYRVLLSQTSIFFGAYTSKNADSLGTLFALVSLWCLWSCGFTWVNWWPSITRHYCSETLNDACGFTWVNWRLGTARHHCTETLKVGPYVLDLRGKIYLVSSICRVVDVTLGEFFYWKLAN